jgi:pSer/pThr/pTyr-binding forkhead associated (FHA) protein
MNHQYPHLLVIKEGPSAGMTYPLEEDEIFIGRESNNSIQIDSPGVSRKHSRLTYQFDQYILEDLASSNGTFVNGERISQPRPLKNGDVIGLGKTIQLEYQELRPTISATMLEDELPSIEGTMLEATPQPTIVPTHRTPADQGVIPASQEPQMTMIGKEVPAAKKAFSPQFLVAVAGEAQKTYSLNKERVTLGRADDNEIVIDSPIVSRYHAYLDRQQDSYVLTVLPNVANPILSSGRPLTEAHKLHHGDILRIGSLDPGMMVTMTYVDPLQEAEPQAAPINFNETNIINIGRDASNDVVLNSPLVSRFHAQIERVGQRHRLIDLRSTNGTFVNDEPIEGEV